MNKKMIAAAMTVSMLCTLSGCCKTKTANTTPISNNAESSAAAADTSENLIILEEETGRTESIDKSDYPIKNRKLSGADSLYEIQASDLGLPQLDVKLFAHLGNAIVIGYIDNGTKISVIDPLNLKIKKTLDISFALDHFTPDCDFPRLYVNENGMAIISEKLNKVLFYDSNFEQIEEIPTVRGINPILISADLKKIIWDDENGTETYVYSRDTNETKTVFKKLCAKNPDHFLQAYDPIADQIFYSVEVGTDVCTYHTQAWDLNRETVASDWGDNEISAPYFDGQNLYSAISDGLQIQNKDSLKKNVLAFDSETEKMGDSIDWKSKMVCTSDFVTNAAENDITFRAYDFEGYKKYETKLVTEQSDSCLIHAIINDNMNYGLMTVDDGGSSHLYVWDFLADNVQVKEQEKFLYASDSILDDKISHRVDELEKKYGFQVQIVDKETITTFHYELAPIEDKNKLLNYLNKIKQEYARYPEGLIQQLIDKHGCGMKVVLSGTILDKKSSVLISGFESSEDGQCLVCYNTANGDIATINHELAHAIHMTLLHWGTKDKKEDMSMCSEWKKLNPEGFLYDENWLSKTYTALHGDDLDDWYFAYFYGKKTMLEDIATLMECAMNEKYIPTKRFQSSKLQAKLKYLSQCIRNEYDTTGWPEKTDWELLLE